MLQAGQNGVPVCGKPRRTGHKESGRGANYIGLTQEACGRVIWMEYCSGARRWERSV